MTKEMALTDIGGGAPVPVVLAGRYRLERPIGRGGMGTVHLARDLVLERRVAIKQLRDLTMDGEVARQRVLHEARALAALRHPGIAAIHDVLDIEPPALVLEYVDGDTWDDWLDHGQPPTTVLAAFTRVVTAVAAAHAAGVVHCDLKPANIVVRADGTPTVLDFGIARLGQAGPESSSGSDETRHPAFTPKWAAPEVLRGLTPTAAADVYALGVMLEDLPLDCTRARQPLPDTLASQLRSIGRKARTESLDIRPADAGVLLRHLEAIGAAGAAPPPASPPTRTSRARLLVITTLLIGGGCVTGGLALVRDGRATPAGGRAPLIAVVPRLDPGAAATTSAAAADLVRDALGPLTRARLVSAEVPALTADVPALVAALKDQGLTHVLVPTVATMRSSSRLSVAVLDARDGSLVHTSTRFGPPGDLPRLAADVASDVKVWLGETPAPAPLAVAAPQPSMLSLGQYSQARQYAERADIAGNLGRAIELLQQVITRDPAYAAAHAELGRVYWLQYRSTREPRDLEAAQLALLDGLTRQPDLPETRITLALLMRERGRYPEAAAALHKVLATTPDDDVALRLLGELEAQQGSVDGGVALIERAVTLRPGSWANHRALGSTLFNAGRYVEAGRSFEVLTQLQPDNPWGYQMLGAARQMTGDLDGAVPPYTRSVELRRTASALSNLATVQYGRGEYALAERLYRDAVALRPRDAVMHRNLGDALLRQSRKADAARAYTAALEAARVLVGVNPEDARAHGTVAYALARLGQCEAAGAEAARTEALASPNPSVTANLANTWTLCGQFPDAFRVVRALKARGATLNTLLEHDVLERLQARPEFVGLL